MAQKKKQEPVEAAKVTRIKATDTRAKAAKKPATKKTTATVKPSSAKKETTKRRNPLTAIGGYFKGAWEELRQVRWPGRRTTWGLTLAVILFTAFFVVLIVLLDLGFQWLFDQILG